MALENSNERRLPRLEVLMCDSFDFGGNDNGFDFNKFLTLPGPVDLLSKISLAQIQDLKAMYGSLYAINAKIREIQQNKILLICINICGKDVEVVVTINRHKTIDSGFAEEAGLLGSSKVPESVINAYVTEEAFTLKRLSAVCAIGAIRHVNASIARSRRDFPNQAPNLDAYGVIINPLGSNFLPPWSAAPEAVKPAMLKIYLAYVTGADFVATEDVAVALAVCDIRNKNPRTTGVIAGLEASNMSATAANILEFAYGRFPVQRFGGRVVEDYMAANPTLVTSTYRLVDDHYANLNKKLKKAQSGAHRIAKMMADARAAGAAASSGNLAAGPSGSSQ